MGRYIASTDEQDAIDMLTANGYHVMRRGTYNNLRTRMFLAEHLGKWDREQRESTERWGQSEAREVQRLADRLTAVVAAAASVGVPFETIATALGEHPRETAAHDHGQGGT